MATKQPIRIGILGLGRAGWGMQIPSLRGRKDFKIVAVCDVETRRLELARAEFGCATYTDYRGLIADANVELVSVASRSLDHARHSITALKAGKTVLVEKPMALNLREADRMLAAARATRQTLIVHQLRRFDTDFVRVKQLADSGKLGRIVRVKLYRHQYQRRDDWQTLRRFGGGLLLNWGPHIVDHGLQFIGGPVKRVFARLNRIAALGDAEDDIKAVLEGENGVVVDIEISGGDAVGSEFVYKIVGTRGALVANDKEIRVRRLARRPKPLKANPGTPAVDAGFGRQEELPWVEETLPIEAKINPQDFWHALYRTVREGRPFPVTPEQAREVVRITELIFKQSGFKAS